MKINPVIMPDGTLNFYHAIIDKLEIENLDGVSESVIESTKAELQAEYDRQVYARNRKAEYEQLNQFEMQFDDQLNGTTTWVDAINAIKQEFPK